MISFAPTDEQALIRDTVREFAAGELRDRARDCDEESRLPDDLLAASWQLGLLAASIPEEHGGAGMARSPLTSVLVLEELGYGCASLGSAVLSPSLLVHPLLDFGTDAQRAEHLPRFAGADFAAGTLALHEPRFIFDPTRMQTTAERAGDGWRLQGAKRWVPLGDRAPVVLVLAREGDGTGLAHVQGYLVPRDAPGLTWADEPDRNLGFQSLPCASLTLDGVEVPASARLGGEAGIDGRRLLACLRVGGAALAVGVCRAMTEIAIQYARDRVAFGTPIGRKQAVAFMIAEMHADVEAMRWLVWKAASLLEQGEDATKAATLARDYVGRKAMKVADDGLQVFGGHGYIRDWPVEMWFRNVRALTLIEGPVCA